MVKKVNNTISVSVTNNNVVGGGWLAAFEWRDEYEVAKVSKVSAWKGANAGKRWIREVLEKNTGRKSVKWIASTESDEKGKPLAYSALIEFKVNA